MNLKDFEDTHVDPLSHFDILLLAAKVASLKFEQEKEERKE